MQGLPGNKKLWAWGNRVYKVKDPRAVIMEAFLETLSREKGNDSSYRILKTVERVAGEYIKQKAICPNVDFFSGSVYDLLGIPAKLFTPYFCGLAGFGLARPHFRATREQPHLPPLRNLHRP